MKRVRLVGQQSNTRKFDTDDENKIKMKNMMMGEEEEEERELKKTGKRKKK